ncbi:hypothetical protein AD928_06730 [Acetobacter cerevisiae]|uniref:Uncharacterized protein n=1 Tax=Acetobacter cerevisiae TaxID=178900 RepID=A0A149QC40_9PROT|nr:hypothetical protein AD928_06730 [Acetobacter cerevisiae]
MITMGIVTPGYENILAMILFHQILQMANSLLKNSPFSGNCCIRKVEKKKTIRRKTKSTGRISTFFLPTQSKSFGWPERRTGMGRSPI